MAKQHTVKQGEHVTRIATQYGFLDYRPIWDHPQNANLVKLRKSPNILFPGDSLFIPDKQAKTEKVPTGKAHKFRLTAPKLKLRIVVKDIDDNPVANVDCELELEGKVHKIKSDKDGLIEQEIPAAAESGKLRVPSLDFEIPVKIGHLDPIDEESGWKARLTNLGYHHRDDALRLKYAIEEFQCNQGVSITGKFDAATLSKLREVHGD